MNARRYITPMTQTLARLPRMGAISRFGFNDVLGWAGLSRHRSRTPTRSAWVAAGVAIGAAAAVLFTPTSGRNLLRQARQRLGDAVGRPTSRGDKMIGAHRVDATNAIR